MQNQCQSYAELNPCKIYLNFIGHNGFFVNSTIPLSKGCCVQGHCQNIFKVTADKYLFIINIHIIIIFIVLVIPLQIILGAKYISLYFDI